MITLGQPVPELPVADVERAQKHYQDKLGFTIAWLSNGSEIGAVSRPNLTIFFRRRTQLFEPVIHWVFAPDVDALFAEWKISGADIVDPLDLKPWGLRQFTVRDLDGHLFHFHQD